MFWTGLRELLEHLGDVCYAFFPKDFKQALKPDFAFDTEVVRKSLRSLDGLNPLLICSSGTQNLGCKVKDNTSLMDFRLQLEVVDYLADPGVHLNYQIIVAGGIKHRMLHMVITILRLKFLKLVQKQWLDEYAVCLLVFAWWLHQQLREHFWDVNACFQPISIEQSLHDFYVECRKNRIFKLTEFRILNVWLNKLF